MKKQLQKITLISALFISVGITSWGQVTNCSITGNNNPICLGESTTLTINNVSNSCGGLSGTLQNGLVGWWPFCGNANDESGNGNNGTVNGAVLTQDRFGNVNQAYSFDGADDRIEIIHNSNLNLSSVSISCWINPTALLTPGGFGPTILSKRESSGWGSSFQMNIGNHAFWSDWTIGTNNGIYHTDNTNLLININTNTHLIYTHDASFVRLYLNGVLVEEIPSPGLLSFNSLPLWFGGRPNAGGNSQYFQGTIDDIGIWNHALTPQEIQDLYNQGNLSTWWSDGTTNQSSIQVQPTQTTTYSVTVSDGVGSCTDSITIQVNNPQINAGNDLSLCAGDSIALTAEGATTYSWNNGIVNGQAFSPTIEGYYTVVGTDTLGCSNSDSLFLDLLQPTASNIERIACDTYTAPDGNVYTSSGQYIAIIPNAEGCDSTIQLALTVNNSSASNQTTAELDSYTWPVNGQTYTQSGVYTAVIPNSKGCDSTITLNLSLEFSGISELNGKEIVITPNPVDASFTLIADSKYIGNEYVITNQQGAIVGKGTIRATKMEVNCGHLAKGIYLFQINSTNQHVIRVMKN